MKEVKSATFLFFFKQRNSVEQASWYVLVAAYSINLFQTPFYVRCIKPNEIKSPVQFNDTRCKHQVMYLGLLENVRVRRAGFAYRMAYDRFLHRYKCIARDTWPNFRGNVVDGVKYLVNSQNCGQDVKYGRSKIFIRSPQTIFAFEEARDRKIPGIVLFLQKVTLQWVLFLGYIPQILILFIDFV